VDQIDVYPMPEPRRPALDDALDLMRANVIRLGALTCEAVGRGTQALLDRDLAGAEHVLEHDQVVDDLAAEIEMQCSDIIATQAPVAKDLRRLLVTLRVVHELERSADLMVNVAKATRRMYPNELDPKIRGIIDQMGNQAIAELRLAIDAYADESVEQASALADMDEAMDELTKSLFRQIFTWGTSEEATLQAAVQTALVGRHFERIADHAVTIAERTKYLVTGETPRGSRHSHT